MKIMSYCDRCGNFDESHENMDYSKDIGIDCIQDYQPDLYYYWDSPIEEDYKVVMLYHTLIVYVRFVMMIYSIQRKIKWVCQ